MSVIHIASSPIEDRCGARQYCRRCGRVLIETADTDRLTERGWRPVFFTAGQLVEEMPGGLAGTRLGLLRDSDRYCLAGSRKLIQRGDTHAR